MTNQTQTEFYNLSREDFYVSNFIILISDRCCPREEDILGAGDEAPGLQGHGALWGVLHPVRLLLRLL